MQKHQCQMEFAAFVCCGGVVEKLERAKGFEPSTQNREYLLNKALPDSSKAGRTQIRAHVLEEAERVRVYGLWPKLPPRIQKAILSLVDSAIEEDEV